MKRRPALLCLTFALSGGCGSYYKVTDTSTGKTYYTSDLSRKGNGAATLVDGGTGNTVTLQNTEIATVTKEQYEKGRSTRQHEPETGPANPFK